ncbi:MAG: hypothetical protein RLZ44_683, partial [Pseudomonadota bacterium]
MGNRRHFLSLLASAVLTGLCGPRAGKAAGALQAADATGIGR